MPAATGAKHISKHGPERARMPVWMPASECYLRLIITDACKFNNLTNYNNNNNNRDSGYQCLKLEIAVEDSLNKLQV